MWLQLLYWGLGFGVLGVFMVVIVPDMDTLEGVKAFLEKLPRHSRPKRRKVSRLLIVTRGYHCGRPCSSRQPPSSRCVAAM